MEMKRKLIYLAIFAIIVVCIGKYIYDSGYNLGYDKGYKKGYKKGYAVALESVTPTPQAKPDTVQTVAKVQTTVTTTVRPKTQQEIVSNAPAVQIKTETPVVQATVNGKKYDFKPQSEILETGVATTAVINVKVPERRWVAGIGYGADRKVSYMLKAPIGKSAVGVWLAGSGRNNYMGGLSVSF